MDELENLWIVGFGALLIGGLIGMLIGRSSPAARRSETLLEELEDTRRELDAYKAEVNTHFAQTADLVNNLTESYRDVHQHLAKGAGRLCNEEGLIKSLQAPQPQPRAEANSEEQPPGDDGVQVPRDYAPRKDAEQGGTLSESYGLDQKEEAETPPHDPSRTADHAAR